MTERERALLMGKKVNPLTANESALAYAVAHGGGSEPTYETVAEIQVGTMVGGDGQYSFTATNVTVPTIDTSATYYLNNSENPSSNVKLVEGNPFFLFNAADPDDFHPEDPSKPLVGLAYNGQEQTCLVLSDTPDLSNTTVRILKKVEQGGGDIPENLKPTYEFGFEMTADGQGNFTVTADEGVTFAALKSALAETPLVFAMVRHGGQLSRIQIQSDRESKIETTVIFYAGNNTFLALDISIAADDTITPTAKTLT